MEIPDLGSDLISVVARTAIVYVFLVLGLRLAGRREVGQLSIFDLVVILVISDAVQNSMVGENVSLFGGIAAAATLITLDRLLSVATGRWTRLRRALEGEPVMLAKDGKVMDAALRRERIDRDELDAAIRGHGIESVADVALAVLETNGSISVIARPGTAGPAGDGPPEPPV